MNWLEVSLLVDGEAAEAVADVLARFTPAGVVIESTRVVSGLEDEGRPAGPFSVRGYLPADASIEGTRRRLEEALWHLRQILPLPEPEFKRVTDEDWAEKWKEHYQPMRIGRRIVIVPAWLSPPLEPDDVAIRLDPGMAFGTGTHPTTQLCLEAIGERLRPGDSVLDLGCGSGILSIAAAKLDSAPVLALDVDAEAVRVARENVAANGVSGKVRVEQGSLADILRSTFPARAWDLVVANILAPVIIRLLDDGLAQTVLPSGTLIVSGILDVQALAVEDSLTRAGLPRIERRQMGDWVALAAGRE